MAVYSSRVVGVLGRLLDQCTGLETDLKVSHRMQTTVIESPEAMVALERPLGPWARPRAY